MYIRGETSKMFVPVANRIHIINALNIQPDEIGTVFSAPIISSKNR